MKSIFLVGFMGAGKTTVGMELAKKLNYKLIDTDHSIENDQSREIKDIFSEDGELFFRNLETLKLKELINVENAIISTGGGIILKDENRSILNNLFTIYLKADFENIFNRIKQDTSRPLLLTDDPYSTAKDIFKSRQSVYESFKIHVCTDNKTPHQVVEEIINLYNA
ncbi:MAG: shikimate kinase [Thermodesulfobacteriota bacterium]|nr:shikimate kinase [Thermodesulfobacteriota bacterium]